MFIYGKNTNLEDPVHILTVQLAGSFYVYVFMYDSCSMKIKPIIFLIRKHSSYGNTLHTLLDINLPRSGVFKREVTEVQL